MHLNLFFISSFCWKCSHHDDSCRDAHEYVYFSRICGIIWRFWTCKTPRRVRGGCVHVASVVFVSKKAIGRPPLSPSEASWSSFRRPVMHTNPGWSCELCTAAHSLHRQYSFCTQWPSYFLIFGVTGFPRDRLTIASVCCWRSVSAV